jgi:hypothetical protein
LWLFLYFAGRIPNFKNTIGILQGIIWILSLVSDNIPILSIIPFSTILILITFATKKGEAAQKTKDWINKGASLANLIDKAKLLGQKALATI